ncbi:hypothetical protein [Spirulina major]|nr:hypothetical protein [Spirulina major]
MPWTGLRSRRTASHCPVLRDPHTPQRADAIGFGSGAIPPPPLTPRLDRI